MRRDYCYGTTSIKRLCTGSQALHEVADRAMEIANKRMDDMPDFGIASVLRTAEEQHELFKQGRKAVNGEWFIVNPAKVVTYCDGYKRKSIHQSGDALDFYAYVNGKYNTNPLYLAKIAACFMQAASDLGYKFQWGGHFSGIKDLPHFNLVR